MNLINPTKLWISLQLLGIRLYSRADDYLARQRRLLRQPGYAARGSVTIENVLWAVAVIAIVAIVVTAITAYVTTQAGKLK